MLVVLQYLISVTFESDMVNHTMPNNGLQSSQGQSNTTDISPVSSTLQNLSDQKVENDSAVQGNVSESLIVPQNQEQPLSHRWDNAK